MNIQHIFKDFRMVTANKHLRIGYHILRIRNAALISVEAKQLNHMKFAAVTIEFLEFSAGM